MGTIPSDISSALRMASAFRSLNPSQLLAVRRAPSLRWRSVKAFSSSGSEGVGNLIADKPSICTADEIHYVSVSNSDWRLALWRYTPSPQANTRNHPLLLLSGVGTNAIGYDLSPDSSFARHMSSHGFDTWILELRGAGLSTQGSSPKRIEQAANEISDQLETASDYVVPYASGESVNPDLIGDPMGITKAWDDSGLVIQLTDTLVRLSERLSGFLSEGQIKMMSAKLLDQISKLLEDSQLSERYIEIRGKLLRLLEARQNSTIAAQIRDLSQRLINVIEDSQKSVSPQLFDLQDRLSTTIDDFQKQLDLIVKYDWDFDHYLEEDVPTAMEYIRAQTKPKDGKLLAIGHSMGGILLYAMLSRCGYEGKDPRLAAVVTLASSLDYTSSKSSLKLFLPLVDPAQALNVPAVPIGALLAAAYPLSSRSPNAFAWLNNLISAEDMMLPELYKKLVLNNFGTIPAKLLLQLATAFREGGLCDRSTTFYYKDHIGKSNVPILAAAGDKDLICPPEAVLETVELIPKQLVTYKVFGEPQGPHYAHYDLVGGRLAVDEVYPCIIQFLDRHDLI